MTPAAIKTVREALTAAEVCMTMEAQQKTGGNEPEISEGSPIDKVRKALAALQTLTSDIEAGKESAGDVKMMEYRDFNGAEHCIDPREIIGFGPDPRGSCYMLTQGGLKLSNMASRQAVELEIEHLLCSTPSAADARAAGDWQPMESAPKDGTKIIVFQRSKHFNDEFAVFWDDDDAYADGGHWFIHDGKTDHPLRGDCLIGWQPLPKPPATGGGSHKRGAGEG